MGDDRRVDELSLEELEELVEEKRRVERARAFAEDDFRGRFRPVAIEPRPIARRKKPRNWRDRLLLAVEIVAAFGLIVIIVNSLRSLQTLNEEVVQAQAAAALAATAAAPSPTASDQLPGGSAPLPDEGELPGSSFAPEALPAGIGVSVQPLPAVSPPPPGPQSPSRIVIQKLSIDWPIVEGDSWEELKAGVGHHSGSANPGERGNMVLSGHNDVFGEVFKDLDRLENGDQVIVYAGGHPYRYAIRARRVVSPAEVSVLAPSREPIVTLITCTPYRIDTMRLVVVGQLVP